MQNVFFGSLARCTVLFAALSAMAACETSDETHNRGEIAEAGKADGQDPCAVGGWYDDADGYCDGDYCHAPDPDCGPDPDACGDTPESVDLTWNGSASSGCMPPQQDELERRTLAAYVDSIRAHKFINRLLEGYDAELIREVIVEELQRIASGIETLEHTNYETSPSRVAFMATMLATRAELTEFVDLLTELEASPGWRDWFNPASICHNIETTEVEIVAEIRAIITARLATLSWSEASENARKQAVKMTLSDAVQAFPQVEGAVNELLVSGVEAMIQTPTLDIVFARLEFFLQVSVTGTLTRLSCPGDDRIEESNVHYEGSRYYNYGAIPEKDIFVLRNDTKYISINYLDDSRRFQAASYRFSLQGITGAGELLAGPNDRSESIVKIRQNGRIERGPAYSRYFTEYGVELPERVAEGQTESLIRSLDAYLAGYLESVQLDLHIQIILGVSPL